MSSLSRRNFLHAGGAAAAGAVVLAGPLSHASATGAAAAVHPEVSVPEVLLPEGEDRMLMYVSNTGSGEIVVMTDGHEVAFHDPQLVARVQRAAKKAGV